VGIAGEYSHPIEFMFGAVIPFVLVPRLIRCHVVTLWIWLLIGVYVVCEQHSGYDFPWNPTQLIYLGGGPPFHDFHHTANAGNYGSTYSHWDYFLGTCGAYERHLAKRRSNSNL
jgi:sterol desaturase/sphingolipid hydroxylase (fatty acid hydroxylase superfamily)